MEKVNLSDIIALKKAGFTVAEIMQIYKEEPEKPKEEPKKEEPKKEEPKKEEPNGEPEKPKEEPEKDYKKLYEETLADLKKAQELNVKKQVNEDNGDDDKTLSDLVSSFI